MAAPQTAAIRQIGVQLQTNMRLCVNYCKSNLDPAVIMTRLPYIKRVLLQLRHHRNFTKVALACALVAMVLIMMGTYDSKETHRIIKQAPRNSDVTETRVVLIGKTGVGKSTTGNTIIGRKVFNVSTSAKSHTRQTRYEQTRRFGRDLHVVDTPGLFDTNLTHEDIIQEVVKSIFMTAPGPHAIILVLSIGRFTEEDIKTLQLFQEVFGTEMMKHAIVLFTRKEDLDQEGISIEEYVNERIPENLTRIITECNNRYIAFSRDKREEKKQVQDLLEIIDKMAGNDSDRFYTTEMFQEAERKLREKERQIYLERQRIADEQNQEVKQWTEEIEFLKKKNEQMKLLVQKEEHLLNLEEQQRRLRMEKEKKLAEQALLQKEQELARLKERIEEEKKVSDHERAMRLLEQNDNSIIGMVKSFMPTIINGIKLFIKFIM